VREPDNKPWAALIAMFVMVLVLAVLAARYVLLLGR
jgi:hypothetical protein